MGNFAEITGKFLANEAAIQVADEQELEGAFDSLISDQANRQALGQAAQKVVQQNEGAVEKTVGMILDGMKSDGMVQQFKSINAGKFPEDAVVLTCGVDCGESCAASKERTEATGVAENTGAKRGVGCAGVCVECVCEPQCKSCPTGKVAKG